MNKTVFDIDCVSRYCTNTACIVTLLTPLLAIKNYSSWKKIWVSFIMATKPSKELPSKLDRFKPLVGFSSCLLLY